MNMLDCMKEQKGQKPVTPQPDRIGSILVGRWRAVRLLAYFYGVHRQAGHGRPGALRQAWSMTRILLAGME